MRMRNFLDQPVSTNIRSFLLMAPQRRTLANPSAYRSAAFWLLYDTCQ